MLSVVNFKKKLKMSRTKHQGLDLPEVSNVAVPAFEDAGKLESGNDDGRIKVNYDGADVAGSVQDMTDVLNLMLNAKLQARQKPLTLLSSLCQQSTVMMLRRNCWS